jgi:hypothetical protein
MRERRISSGALHVLLTEHGITISRSHLFKVMDGNFSLLRIDLLMALLAVLACNVEELLVHPRIEPETRRSANAQARRRSPASDVAPWIVPHLGKLGAVRPVGVRIRDLSYD